MLIVVDAGHGGQQPGAESAIGTWEKDAMLGLAFGVEDELRALGHEVLLTRAEDVSLNLRRRVELANEAGARVFCSLHWNASTSERPNGSQVFFNPGSDRGHLLAEAILERIRGLDGDVSEAWERTEARGFYVLAHTVMPAVLVETEFASNEAEARRLATPSYMARMAEGIAQGLDAA